MQLAEFESLDIFSDAVITGVSIDSKAVASGDLFVAMPGEKFNGHDFIEEALLKGASAVAVTRPDVFENLANKGIPTIRIGDPIEFCWQASCFVYDHPSRNLQMVGITGTNGKTTTAWILSQMLNLCGQNCAYVGTLGAHFGSEKIDTNFTTPFPPALNRLLIELKNKGADSVAMEVSSHALAQKRIDGTEFDAAVFTNLTQDHLDYHGNMENYFESKKRLFGDLPSTKPLVNVINVDDEWGKLLFASTHNAIGYGKNAAEMKLLKSSFGPTSLEMKVCWHDRTYDIKCNLGAYFNVYNTLAALTTAVCLGIPMENCVSSLSNVKAAPGRFEPVETSGNYSVIVDYAHTPDALEKLLESARQLNPSRIIAVFGCGGDRDKTKRPLMGAAVSKKADYAIVTSDNPRTEMPEKIIADILPGINKSKPFKTIVNRRDAIFEAIEMASKNDIVIIAGKGHEDYQIIGTEKIHFDDREVAAEAIKVKRE